MNISENDFSFGVTHPKLQAEKGSLLREIRTFISRYQFILFVPPFLTTAAALLYVLYLTPLYTASATVLLQNQRGGIFTQEANGGVPYDVGEIETQMEIARSESVAKEVAANIDVDAAIKVLRTRSKIDSLLEGLREIGGSGPTEERDPKNADEFHDKISTLQDGLKVYRPGLSYTLNILYTAPDAKLASRLTNAFAQAYISVQRQARYDVLRRANAWIEERSLELKSRAEEATKKLEYFRSEELQTVGRQKDETGTQKEETNVQRVENRRIQLVQLEAMAKSFQEAYESFIRRSAETTQQLTAPGPDAVIINEAFAPKSPSFPRKKLIVLGAMMVGLALGVLLSLAYRTFSAER